MKRLLFCLALLPFYGNAQVASADSKKLTPPNVIFIMADDMGYGDPGCNNPKSKIPTPNIDSLAKGGMRFTDAHAPGSVCVPTRYSLMTGRYPMRMPRRGGSRINPDTLTVGAMLQKQGYRTACVGKWHLGFDLGSPKDYAAAHKDGPADRGFHSYFGIPASLDIPPYYYVRDRKAVAPPTNTIEASNSPGWTPIQGAFWRKGGIAPGFKHIDVLPDLTGEAIKVLEQHQKATKDKPLFLYFALPAPHTPWLPTKQFQGKTKVGSYGDFTVQVDDAVGQVLKTLERLKMSENTLVIFTSDNGPVWYPTDVKKYQHACTGVFRGMKGDAWEGGHRMPFLARWPGVITPGSVSAETICHVDLMATLADILKLPLPKDQAVDSHSFLPSLLGQKLEKPIREATIHQASSRTLAVRQGPWKLIPQLGSGGFSKPRKIQPMKDGPKGQLYHLGKDPGETTNLYQKHPEIVKRLSGILKRYQSEGRSRP